MPSRGTRSIRILVSLGGAINCCIFFIIRGIGGDILCVVLPHAALIAVEEHLIHLLLIILCQCLLLNSKPGPELLKLFVLRLRSCLKILELLLQLISLLLSDLALSLCSLFFLSHPASFNLCHFHPLLQFLQSLLCICGCYPDGGQLALYPPELSAKFFIVIYLSSKKYLHTLRNLQQFEERVSLSHQAMNSSHPLKQ